MMWRSLVKLPSGTAVSATFIRLDSTNKRA